jgi:hypothetical protein
MLDCALLKDVASDKFTAIFSHDEENNGIDIRKFSKCVRETYSATYRGDNVMRMILVEAAVFSDSVAPALLDSPNFKEDFEDHEAF